jgi:hypothetical protein
MFLGGVNPFADAHTGLDYTSGAATNDLGEAARAWVGGLNPPTAVGGGGGGISLAAGGFVAPFATNVSAANPWLDKFARDYQRPEPETLAEAVTRRIYTRYHDDKAAAAVEKNVAPIYAARGELGAFAGGEGRTGGNVWDMLLRFGPEASAQYLQTIYDQPERVDPAFAPEALKDLSALWQEGQRETQLATLQERGSGAATVQAVQRRISLLTAIPALGGTRSVAYGQAQKDLRDAQQVSFEQSLFPEEQKLIPLQGALERAEVLPFSPSNIYATSLKAIQLQQAEVAKFDERLKNGHMDEATYEQTQRQREDLLTQIAREKAMLTTGLENLLPALSAGMPSGFSRYDSDSLAALRVGKYRFQYGATGGKQAEDQLRYSRDLGDTGPYSRTQDINHPGAAVPTGHAAHGAHPAGVDAPAAGSSSGAGSDALLAQAVQLLAQIARALTRNGAPARSSDTTRATENASGMDAYSQGRRFNGVPDSTISIGLSGVN